jgi:hypothetical protein
MFFGMNRDVEDVGHGRSPLLALRAGAIRFFPRETRVLEATLVEIVGGAIRTNAPSLGGDRIEDRSQSMLRGLDFEECLLDL